MKVNDGALYFVLAGSCWITLITLDSIYWTVNSLIYSFQNLLMSVRWWDLWSYYSAWCKKAAKHVDSRSWASKHNSNYRITSVLDCSPVVSLDLVSQFVLSGPIVASCGCQWILQALRAPLHTGCCSAAKVKVRQTRRLSAVVHEAVWLDLYKLEPPNTERTPLDLLEGWETLCDLSGWTLCHTGERKKSKRVF